MLVTLKIKSGRAQEMFFTLQFITFNYMLKRYVTDDSIASADVEIRRVTLKTTTVKDYAQQL